MLMLLSASSIAYASEDVSTSDTEIDIELLEFLGDTAGLESLGVDIDGLLGILDVDGSADSAHAQRGGNYEN